MNNVYQTEETTVRLLETKDEPTLVKWLSDGRPIGYIQIRRAKQLPQHELHEGQMRDCWLMEYAPETDENE